MVPTHFTEIYTAQNKIDLLKLARQSIAHGLDTGFPLIVDISDWSEPLINPAACFVTLKINKQLRGCIGHLSAEQPLVKDVAENAYSAAFRDSRFSKLTPGELNKAVISISVLTKPEPIHVENESDLIAQIRPGVDGIIIKDGIRKGTFLPVVWESLPDKKEFITQLKLKANLPTDYWSDTIEVFRYRAINFSE